MLMQYGPIYKIAFLLRDGMRKRGTSCWPMSVRLSVRPSVRPSVTLVYCIKTAKDIVKRLSTLVAPLC